MCYLRELEGVQALVIIYDSFLVELHCLLLLSTSTMCVWLLPVHILIPLHCRALMLTYLQLRVGGGGGPENFDPLIPNACLSSSRTLLAH